MYSNITVLLLAMVMVSFVLSETQINRQKLVCSQPDGSIEARKGVCYLSNFRCKDDCSIWGGKCITVGELGCYCADSDLIYAQDKQLANCTVWNEDKWKNYVLSSRQDSEKERLNPAGSNTPDGNGLLFSTTDNGLAWPITSGRDIGQLIPHGPHCLHMIEMFNQQIRSGQKLDNVVDRTHSEHCRRLARRVLNYYESEKSYRVEPSAICNDVRTLYDAPLGQLYGYASYRYFKTNNNQQSSKSDLAHSVYEYLHTIGEKELKSSNIPQQSMLSLLSGQNLGNLLVKDWLELPLTDVERSWVRDWESHEAVRLAALGIYCIQGEGKYVPTDKIHNLLLMKQQTDELGLTIG